ncbi:helix-turn-helix domain-containing protein [Maribacter sp.]|uniref:helix-turn-helix domain-containing protein n=1 Tax=Maribacter sp. TaxID=1897614 RepID=UPI003298FB03
MEKIVVTTTEELAFMIDQSVDAKFTQLKKFMTEQLNPPKRKYTVKEAATKFNVTDLTVRNWIKKGYLKGDKIGRRVLIDASELEKSLTEIKSLKYKRL